MSAECLDVDNSPKVDMSARAILAQRRKRPAPKAASRALASFKFVGVSRNKLCMCKSGKKFKHCCLGKYENIRRGSN